MTDAGVDLNVYILVDCSNNLTLLFCVAYVVWDFLLYKMWAFSKDRVITSPIVGKKDDKIISDGTSKRTHSYRSILGVYKIKQHTVLHNLELGKWTNRRMV